MLDQPNLNDK